MNWDQWGPSDVLGRRPVTAPKIVPAAKGLVVEDASSGFTGAIVRVEKSGGFHLVVLAGRGDLTRSFPLGPGFLIDGEPIELVVPAAGQPARPQRTASGSRAVGAQRAKVAKASRIWVEGVHDAELVEKIWGDDLRVEGVVVEPLHGIDDLAGAVEAFRPAPRRRLAVLLDHLVTGSKEERIAAEAMRASGAQDNVLIVGHPYVDIWQAVKPEVIGIKAWPKIPRNEDWKTGMLARLGLPHDTPADVGLGWKKSQLLELGLRLGADVPVFIFGTNAFAEGIGEALSAIDLPVAWYLVLTPPVHVPTVQVFGSEELTRNTIPIKIPPFCIEHGHNDLEPVVCRLYPEVARHLEWLKQLDGPRIIAMTGSGACVFAEFATERAARSALSQVPSGMNGFVAQGLDHHPMYDFAE